MMNPKIIENMALLVAGIESTSRAGTISQDLDALGIEAERSGLAHQLKHKRSTTQFLALLWNWSSEEDFPIMAAMEVTSFKGQPEGCVMYRFPTCDYASIPMQGVAPDLVEPWPDIFAWYPLPAAAFTTTFRRYDESSGTGEILIPLAAGVTPERIEP